VYGMTLFAVWKGARNFVKYRGPKMYLE